MKISVQEFWVENHLRGSKGVNALYNSIHLVENNKIGLITTKTVKKACIIVGCKNVGLTIITMCSISSLLRTMLHF